MVDIRRHNCVLIGDERYFLLRADARWQMVRDRCPHRGGPLSLGRRTPDGRRLTCPWHGTKVAVAALCRTALPMVRSGEEAMVVLPDTAADAPVAVVHRRILANLPPATHRDDTNGRQRHGGERDSAPATTSSDRDPSTIRTR